MTLRHLSWLDPEGSPVGALSERDCESHCDAIPTSVVEEHVEWGVVQEKWNCDQGRADVDVNEQVDNDRSMGQGRSRLWVPEAHVASAPSRLTIFANLGWDTHFVVSTQLAFGLVPCEQLLSVCLIRKRARGKLLSKVTSTAGRHPSEVLVMSGLLLGKLTAVSRHGAPNP